MPGKKRSRRKTSTPTIGQTFTSATFAGLNIGSTGSEPAIRNMPAPSGSSYQQKRKLARETLGKAEHDMSRWVFTAVATAIANPVRLPFRVYDFIKKRDQNAIPIAGSGAFGDLNQQLRFLEKKDGPRVVVDLDDVVVLWYLPGFLGTGLQKNLVRSLAELTKVYLPRTDEQVRDRRATTQALDSGNERPEFRGPLTRSGASRQAAMAGPAQEEQEGHGHANGTPPDALKEHVGIQEPCVGPVVQSCSEPYHEDDGRVRIGGLESGAGSGDKIGSYLRLDDSQANVILAQLMPFAYYFSPGWFQTGMQYRLPIQASLHFCKALMPASLSQTITFLESKRLYDKKVALLTEIIHASLYDHLRVLRSHMSAVKGPTQTAVVNGWTSAFPCFGVGVNRTTAVHRDTRGIRGGLDIIGVLGNFTQGGDLEFPDLNLRLEWVPGCLAAFDGYDFRHGVREWEGGSWVTLISFCQQAIWSGLGLELSLSRPNLTRCGEQLALVRRGYSEKVRVHGSSEELTGGLPPAAKNTWRKRHKLAIGGHLILNAKVAERRVSQSYEEQLPPAKKHRATKCATYWIGG